MIKNALEASLPDATVTISCAKSGEKIRFSVHNTTFIPRDIQLQLFKRSFTTKGVGRGLGTYSMKLLGEKYLKGKVGFESTEQNGTTFFIEI
jgi:sensor histidine kinase regulating citrate/malate metabolism